MQYKRKVRTKIVLTYVNCYCVGVLTYHAWYYRKNKDNDFDKQVLRTISGHEKEKVSGSWRKFQHSELHEQYSSANVIRDIKEIEDEIGVACGIYRTDGKCICTKHDGNSLFERARQRWQANMKDPNEVGKQYMKYVCFTQDKSQWWVLVKNYVLCILA